MTTEALIKPLDKRPSGGFECWRCGKKLIEEVTPPYKIICERCKAVNKGVE